MTAARPDIMTKLVLCADDYGMNAGVSRGILALAARGRISATSCMTGAPDWRDASRDLVSAAPDIGIGLHVTLTWGRPLGSMPGFAGNGAMPTLGSVLMRALMRRLPLAEIRAEIDRQLDCFEVGMGRPPDFVDGHQHVHVLPGIRDALLSALARRGLAGRIWLRDPSDRVTSILARRLSAGKALLVGALARGFRAEAAKVGFRTNDGFSGFSPFDPTRRSGPDMTGYLDRLGARPLVMCHPGLADPTGDPDEIAPARAAEYAYLASPEFGDLMERRSIVLAPAPVWFR